MAASYLAPLVGVTEIAGGVFCLFRRALTPGLLILTPVMVNILAFHAYHKDPGTWFWVPVTIAFFISA